MTLTHNRDIAHVTVNTQLSIITGCKWKHFYLVPSVEKPQKSHQAN